MRFRLKPISALVMVVPLVTACGGSDSAPSVNTSVIPVAATPFQATTAAITGDSTSFGSSLNPISQFTELSFAPDDEKRIKLNGAVRIGFDTISIQTEFTADDLIFEDERSRIYRQILNETKDVQLSIVLPLNPVDQLEFTSFGYWLVDEQDMSGLTQTHFAYGIPSQISQLAILGNAEYAGLTEGHLLGENNERSFISGQIGLSVDFSEQSITGQLFDLTAKSNSTGLETSLQDFSIIGAFVEGENRIIAALDSEDSALSGDMNAHFFGPADSGLAPPEIGGTWRFGQTGLQAVGAFGAKVIEQNTSLVIP